MLATVAAAAFIACSKEIQVSIEPDTPMMKTITITTDVLTKSTLDAGHENLVWSTGDKISVFNDQNNTNAELSYAPSGYMTVDVPAGTTEVYGHYPYYKSNTSGPSSVSVYISKSQTQKNPGELAGNNYPMVAKGTVTADNKANMIFYPVASALALNIYHTGLVGTEKVSKVVVTPHTDNTLFTGSQNTDITANNVAYTSAASSDPITVTLTNALTLGSTKPADAQAFDGQIYVCLAKQSYAQVNFEITTDKGVYSITSNSTPFDCENNDFVPVNINLNKASFTPGISEPTEKTGWYRVESANWLSAGDRVAIVANGYNVAASSADNGNNRKSVAVTKTTDDGYAKMTFTTSVQEFILEDGTKSGSFGFWCDNGDKPSYYIYASSSSSNYMKSQEDLDDNASFAVSIADGVAIVTAQGSNTRNIIKYNDSNDLFSCYSSGQKDIAIYKYYGAWAGSTTCVTPTISQEGSTVTIASTTAGATIYYTVDGSTPTSSSTKYTAPFSLAESATIKAIAIRSHYTDSDVASHDYVATVATPVISSSANAFTITCATEGATIYYEVSTTDLASVATPTTSSSSYSAAVDYVATTYVKAYAVKAGYNDSAVASATCAYSSGGSYSWVATPLANITTSDVFVIVGDNGSAYAMSNDNSTSSAPSAISVTIVSSKITTIVADNMKWHLTKDGANYTFYPGTSGTSTWLYCTNTNNGVRVGTNANKTFTLDTSGYLKHVGTSRYVGIYNSADWRCYTEYTTNNIKDQSFAFYVYKAD